MDNASFILHKGFSINNKYVVTFPLKKGDYAESYRVKDKQGITKYLKLFSYSLLKRTQFDNVGNILEIEILKTVNHPNVVRYCDSGDILIDKNKFAFLILDFISGETLADKMKRDRTITPFEAKNIVLGVLNGLNYLHNLNTPVIHNEITNLNIMLDLSGEGIKPIIIDFGYARYLSQTNKEFQKEGLNPFYLSNETFNNVFSIQSDIFSAGVLYYHILFGLPPWFFGISQYLSDKNQIEDKIIEKRKHPLTFMDAGSAIDNNTINVITKALQPEAHKRFKSVTEFIKAINEEIKIEEQTITNGIKRTKAKKIKNGKGFSAIAGMQELKEMIKTDVIDALNNKEEYAEYGLTIPNGILLYGPPGCGKTFFAERLAEEIGFNFYQIKPSDIQSKWVNASQENIKKLFDDAREKAPSIIFIDELDAVVPNRDNISVNHMNTSAVNEFLAQMNNCGEDGIFIIGATNRPESIDTAILRAGRLDKLIFIPPPDFQARKLMFELYLNKRPVELGLDYSELATKTENYVSSDIKFLCDEASRIALKAKSKITKEILLQTISKNKSSVSLSQLNSYEATKDKIEGDNGYNKTQRRIGF